MTWQATVHTLFPAMFPGPLGGSLAGRALDAGLWRLDVRDIRGAATDRHRTVDDTPFGGGAGMVMRPDVLDAALGASDGRPLLYMTPRGRPLQQSRVRTLAEGPGVAVVCGRYEGVDQRVLDTRGFEEVAVGDAVLAGGEAAACVVIEACVRLVPGVLGNAASTGEESFEDGLLEHPQYTRPRTFEGLDIPEVLLGGNHGAVAAWRKARREDVTRERRPDLWSAHPANQQPKGAKARRKDDDR